MAETPTRQLQQPQTFITMAVNSLDHGADEVRVDFSREDMDFQLQHRGLQKVKSTESFNKPKKGSFVITRVVTKTPGDGDDHSMDDHDFDETNTEDLSSDLLDVSKTTDIEPDMSSEDTVHSLAQEEMLKECLLNAALPTPVHAAASPGPAAVVQSGQPPQHAQASAPPTSENSQPEVPAGLKDKVNDTQSRFKVVKIESSEPFKRGRWRCLDYLHPPSSEKPAEKAEKVIEEAGSGNSSAASSVHYIPGVDDPSKNPLGASLSEGHQILEPKPVHPLQNGAVGQVASMGSIQVPNAQMGTVQAGAMKGQGNIVQSQPAVLKEANSVPGNVIQTSMPTTQTSQQSLNSQAVPRSQAGLPLQNVILSSTQANIATQHPLDINGQQYTTQPQTITLETLNSHVTQAQSMTQAGQAIQSGIPPASQQQRQGEQISKQQQDFNIIPAQQQDFIEQPAEFGGAQTPQTVPQSQHDATIINNAIASGSQDPTNNPQTTVAGDIASQAHAGAAAAASVSSGNSPSNENQHQNKEFAAQEHGYAASIPDEEQQQQQHQQQHHQHLRSGQTGESRDMLAIKHMSNTLLSPPLLEMVSATMHPHGNLMNQNSDEDSNASTVAIDNKIEQAMDLVKSHLMFAVREEVEVLKEQIKELTEKNNHLMEKNSQLEYENNILKGAAAPETLAELQGHKTVGVQPSTTTS